MNHKLHRRAQTSGVRHPRFEESQHPLVSCYGALSFLIYCCYRINSFIRG